MKRSYLAGLIILILLTLNLTSAIAAEVTSIEIIGPETAKPSDTINYTAIAHMDNGTQTGITSLSEWALYDPLNTIENGVLDLTLYNIPSDQFTLEAKYIDNNIEYIDTIHVIILRLDGEGTPESPFLIQSIDDAKEFINSVKSYHYWTPNTYTKLMIDFNAEDLNYNELPGYLISSNDSTALYDRYDGHFDGNNHTFTSPVGLFETVGSEGIIHDLIIDTELLDIRDFYTDRAFLCKTNNGLIIDCHTNATITIIDYYLSEKHVGTIAAFNNGIIQNSTSNINLRIYNLWGYPEKLFIGGMVGQNSGSIINCHSSGVFDGNGGIAGENSGLIDTCSSSATMMNLYNVGGITANSTGQIKNCYFSGTISGTLRGESYDSASVGGIAAQATSIINSYNSGTITGNYFTGGICGRNTGTIQGCANSGTISGDNWSTQSYTGGIVGIAEAPVSYCYNTGSVAYGNCVGGIIGLTPDLQIDNCYSVGPIEKTYGETGALIGYAAIGSAANCFWNTDTISVTDIYGGIEKTTAELQTRSTYTAAGWDFTTTDNDLADWKMPKENGYPILARYFSYEIDKPNFIINVTRPLILSLVLPNTEDSTWSISGDESCPWITDVQPTSGTALPVQQPVSIELTIDTTTIAYGFYSHPLTVTMNQDQHFYINIDISVITLLGQGTAKDPFQINTPLDIQNFADEQFAYRFLATGVHTKLMADLDMNPSVTGIPPFSAALFGDNDTPFSGTFDGNNHTISNLTITDNGENTNNLALFHTIDKQATVQNLNMANTLITSSAGFAAALATYSHGTVDNCTVSGMITGDYEAGGLIANNFGLIKNSHTSATVNATNDAGGLVGVNLGQIINCTSNAIVQGSENMGGLVGTNQLNSLISNSSSKAQVTGDSTIGGLIGFNFYSGVVQNCMSNSMVNGNIFTGGFIGYNNANIYSCYDISTINGGDICGGFAGYNDNSIENCYSLSNIQGNEAVGGFIGYNDGTINQCFSTSLVSGNEYIEGFAGFNDLGVITNSFWDVNASTIGTSGDDNYGATGKTTAEMQTLETFTNAGWDIDTIWLLPNGNYPHLAWENLADLRYGLNDFAILAQCWMSDIAQCPACSAVNYAEDTTINIVDLQFLAEHWLEMK